MTPTTLRAMMWLALLTLGQPQTKAKAASDSDCFFNPTQRRVVYCESVPLGFVVLASGNARATSAVSFESKFFAGLERVRKSQGSEFRKSHHQVTNYPREFILVLRPLDSDEQISPPEFVPKPAIRVPEEIRPRRVIVRWRDSSQRILAERSGTLQELEEPWTELSRPRVWYRATITGVSEPLAATLEVLVIGAHSAALGRMRGNL